MYHFTECGLDYVYLENGYECVEVEGYGKAYHVESVDDLHKAIAYHIVTDADALTGQEVRFLRSMLGLSQKHLGQFVGKDRGAVARWEGARDKKIEKTESKFLKAIAADRLFGDDLFREVYQAMEIDDAAEHGELRMSNDGVHWNEAA